MSGCTDTDCGCVFSRALLARAAACECAQRRSLGEREVLECTVPVARSNCGLLMDLLRERARFALRLPVGAAPLVHAQVLRLQCGGVVGLQQALSIDDSAEPHDVHRDIHRDIHRLVQQAQARHGSLTDLPWDAVVQALRDWSPRRRRHADTRPGPAA